MRRYDLPIVLVLSLAGLLGVSILGCDSANPIAPSGSTLTVTANPTLIGLNESSLIIVTGFKPDGNPLNPGSRVNLATDLGVLDSTVIEIDNTGRGQTRLRGDGRSGSATVTASLPAGDAMATATVQIGQSAETRPTLSIVVSPSTIDLGESAAVELQARNADGSRFGGGGRVRLRTNLGRLDDTSLVTDSAGEASTTFRAEDQPGTATITGSVESSDDATFDVTIENQKPTLIVNANPSRIPVLGTSIITVIARDNNDVPLGRGERIRLIADLGTVSVNGQEVDEVFTDNNGEAEATFTAGSEAGQASVTAILGTSDPVSTTIELRDAVASISLEANPRTISRIDAGVPISLLARVLNSQSRPVAGVVVIFSSQFGSFSDATRGSVPSNAQGEARETLTVTTVDVATVPANGTFTITATVVSEGVELQDDVLITVQ